MRIVWIGIIAWLMLCIPMSYAVEWSEPNALEIKLLPNFCTVKYREHHGDGAALSEGRALMGPQFDNVHHYCNGLNFLNHYYRSQGHDAATYLSLAINEFTYMVDHPKPNSPIGAQILLQRGIAYSIAKRYPEAINDLQRAVTLNPKLTQTYITLADNFEKIKARDKALEVVSEGLRQIPDSKVLKRRYDELGGKQPYPEAVVAAPVSQQTEPQEEPTVPVRIHEPSETPTAVNEAGPGAEGQQEGTTMPSGTSKNPWCRFCAD